MRTTTLFVIGLVAGAIIVFGIRAASLDSAGAQQVPSPEPTSPAAHEHATAPPSEAKPAVIQVVLDADGKIASATMEMEDGTTHAVAPGAHAPMGDYPARVKGREGTFEAHLHAHSEHEIELTLMSDEGDLVAQRTFAHAAAGAAPDGDTKNAPAGGAADMLPENQTCPVMGNPVDPKVFVDHNGRRIGFCCPGCDDLFKANPEKYLKKVDAEIAARSGGK